MVVLGDGGPAHQAGAAVAAEHGEDLLEGGSVVGLLAPAPAHQLQHLNGVGPHLLGGEQGKREVSISPP